MTMIPCPKCGQSLVRDDASMCADCAAAGKAAASEKRSASWRKAKAWVILFVQMLAALSPILKPIWEKTLAKPITAIVLGLVLWSVLSAPGQKSTSPAPVASKAPTAPAEAVVNSAWDGSVWQVERYLERNLKDPDSFEAIDWFPVVKSDGTYIVRCRYRAKNSFGGFVIEDRLFQLSHDGEVIAAVDFDSIGAKK